MTSLSPMVKRLPCLFGERLLVNDSEANVSDPSCGLERGLPTLLRPCCLGEANLRKKKKDEERECQRSRADLEEDESGGGRGRYGVVA